MPLAGISSLVLIIVISWCFAGGTDWSVWAIGAGGLLSLILAIVEPRHDGAHRWKFTWHPIPWLLLLACLTTSYYNPSHKPKIDHMREPRPLGYYDTRGMINPADPVSHIEWLPTTSDRERTLRYGCGLAGLFAMSIGLAIAPWTRAKIRRFLVVLFVNAALLTLAGIWFFFEDPKQIFGSYAAEGGNPFASFHYKNCWAGFVILMISCSIGLSSTVWKPHMSPFTARNPALLYIGLSLLMALTLPLCQSRAGLLLLGIFVIWFCLRAIARLRRYQAGPRQILWQGAAPVALILGGIAFGWQAARPQLQDISEKTSQQFEQQIKGQSLDGRVALIEDTFHMAQAKPWFGWGLATFSQVYPMFQRQEMYERIDLADDDFDWIAKYYEFAHCDWVQYLAEIGVVGLVLLVATPLAYYLHARRRGHGSPLTHWLFFGCLLVLLLAGFEFPFGCEAVGLVFAAFFSLACAHALRGRSGSHSRAY